MNRDEYVQKLKTQLDVWNAEAAKWEAKAKQAQAGAEAEYRKQLETFRRQRDEAMKKLVEVQSASGEAWQDMMKGADAAWKAMQEAFGKARSHFDRKP